jgi:plasmid stabilization system protein ParE
MPRGDKSSYSAKQQRKARHIEESYEEKGLSEDEAERRAWATVNKGSARGKSKTAAKRNRSASAKKAARTRAAQG